MAVLWNTTLNQISKDDINEGEEIKVSIEKGEQEDTVYIGDYTFEANDIIQLAQTVSHVTSVY